MSNERPVRTSIEELNDFENETVPTPNSSFNHWLGIIETGDPWALALEGIEGLTIAEAKWIHSGIRWAEEEGVVTSAGCDTWELVASALHDIARKPPHRFWRKRFVEFVSQALRIRFIDESDASDDVTYAHQAWPL